jgi:hypothetical protein
LVREGHLTTSDDFDNFEAVAGLELALGKFGGCDGLAVVFDDDAARKQVLREEKLLKGARKVALDSAVVGDDEGHLLER